MPHRKGNDWRVKARDGEAADSCSFYAPVSILAAMQSYCLQHDMNKSNFIKIAVRERLKSLGVEF